MWKRLIAVLAGVLTGFGLAAGAASGVAAGATSDASEVVTMDLYPQTFQGGTPQSVPEANITTTCSDVDSLILPNGALSVVNSTAKTVELWSGAGCTGTLVDTVGAGKTINVLSQAVFSFKQP